MWNIIIQSLQANRMIRVKDSDGFSPDYWETHYDLVWGVNDCVVINVFYVEE